MENVLEVDHLSVRFGRIEVLSDLNIHVARGSCLAIIGPNGAGKTLFFQALIGSIPFDGSIRWAPGERIGYVPQKLDLQRDVPITGIDFLRARAGLAGEDGAQISHVCELVGIPANVGNSAIGMLSGGQFQRLLVAFALLGRPTVLLLDEPTAGMDGPGQKRLNGLMRYLQQEQGLTVLFISHELSVVYQSATNVLCLGRQTACFGPPTKILEPGLLADIYGAPVDFHAHDS